MDTRSLQRPGVLLPFAAQRLSSLSLIPVPFARRVQAKKNSQEFPA
jgi:hypothetical protein